MRLVILDSFESSQLYLPISKFKNKPYGMYKMHSRYHMRLAIFQTYEKGIFMSV